MSIGERLLPEFDHEMSGTRKVLERVPLERYDWTPHPKSFSLGRLANHLAGLLRWGSGAMSSQEFDFAQGGYTPSDFRTAQSLLAGFDRESGRDARGDRRRGGRGLSRAVDAPQRRRMSSSPCRGRPSCATWCSITTSITAVR